MSEAGYPDGSRSPEDATAPDHASPGVLPRIGLLKRAIEAEPVWIRVTGRSMGRSIPSGTTVRVARDIALRRGRTYAFVEDGGSIVVHRFRGREGDSLWFRGDGNSTDDRSVAPERILGRVIEVRGRRRPTALDELWGRLRLDALSVRRRIRRQLRARRANDRPIT